MAEKQTNKERLKDITDSIETGIKELFESDKYRQYLATMSRFHRYSVNNTMLIYMQRPDATHVAGFNKWRDQFGRNVKKGEKGIKIIAPTPFKKKIEQQKLDPDTKLPLRDENGDIITEEKTVQIPMYKPVVVFDVQQTAGKPLPKLAANLTGDVQNYGVFMEALRRSAPVPIFFEKLAENMDGYFSVDKQRIAVREGMSEVQTVCAAVHEIAHSKLHNKDEIGEKYQEVELFGNGDYLIPDLTLSETPEETKPLGKYGRLRRSYLQEHRPGLYSRLVLSEKLFPHLREIDETANRRLEQMMPELMKSAGVTEELKARDQMKWVGLMNSLKTQAEEIILSELVYN